MDQDKAQQSIDTLSEKVNGVVRSVRVSCSPENDYRGEKDYRSVFGVQEIECLYVDTEVLNKQFEGEPWEGKMTVRLFRLENGKGQCLSVKERGIKVERQDALPVYEERIDRGTGLETGDISYLGGYRRSGRTIRRSVYRPGGGETRKIFSHPACRSGPFL